jgi:acetate CoA/acetoacetate CoA-transferase alpha subunit
MVKVGDKEYIYEPPIRGDVSIVYARKADTFGNLVFDKTARNTNPYVAMAGKITIAEADEIVPEGGLNPEEVIVPGIYIQHVVQSKGYNWKWIWETPEK